MDKQAITVTYGNFKGGTGKTTNAAMTAYALSEKGYKTLLVDLDPQANATSLMYKTAELNGEEKTFDKTLMVAILEQNLSQIITNIKGNLDLIPSYVDFHLYVREMEKRFSLYEDRVRYFGKMLEPLKTTYDFILIDVPPTISLITDSALCASDYVTIVLQTQEWSVDGAQMFVEYLQSLIDDYDATMDIAGVLPVILKKDSKNDVVTLQQAQDIFGHNNMFGNIVYFRERLKRYTKVGISKNIHDAHDKKIHAEYDAIATEFLQKVGVSR